MPEEPQPTPPVGFPTIEQQMAQAQLNKHFELWNTLRTLRISMLLFTNDGPVHPALGEQILREIDGMRLIIQGAMKPAAESSTEAQPS